MPAKYCAFLLLLFAFATPKATAAPFGYLNGVSLASAGSLTSGCATAGSSGYLYIDTNTSLTANTTLDCNLVVAGGVISMGSYNLTVNGAISGDGNTQLVNVGTGSLSIAAGNVLQGAWFTGPYGNSSVDYQPGLQQAYNIVCRVPGTSGPRVLNVQGTGDSQTSNPGIFLHSPIIMPTDAYGCTTLDAGTAWEMTTSDDPFFEFKADSSGSTETQAWSWLGSPATTFAWSTTPTTDTTDDVVFALYCDTGSDGHHNIKIDGATVVGYSFISTEGSNSCFNGWWASDIRNIYATYMTGPTIYHHPGSGGSERQNYFNITNISHTGTAGSVFDIENVGGLTIDQWSIDGYGQENPITSPAISLVQVTNFDVRGGHIENVYSNLSYSGLIQIYDSQGAVDHLQVYSWNPSASSIQGVFGIDGGSKALANDVSISNTQSASGAQLYGVISGGDGTSQIEIGRQWTQDANITSFLNSNLGSGTWYPQQIFYTGEQQLPPLFGADVESDASETDLTVAGVTGSNVMGTPVGQGGNITRVTYTIAVGGVPTALTAGSLTVKFYNGSTLLGTYTLTSSSAAQGYLFVNGPFGNGTQGLTTGSNFRTTVTALGITQTTVSLQVQTSYLPLGS